MCTVCGCGDAKVEGLAHNHDHDHDHDHGHGHDHHHGHGHGHYHHHHDHAHHHHGELHFGQGPAGVAVPGMSQERLIEIETGILAKNDRYAAENRAFLRGRGVFAVNLVSSPGSGKTTLLCRTIEALGGQPLAVIEGDQQTANDADRIRATGAPAVQVNTGKGCHLDGHMVGHAIEHLDPRPESLLFIENVGNLVCPAGFDLGEDCKVAILSVTEGEDKPLKYPDMFTAARLAILNKIDLAPHCDVDLDLYEANLRRVNPGIEILRVSARTGEGMEAWTGWLRARLAEKIRPRAAE
ncbi:Hydrogenase nickel incorporation protein HypB [Ruegeria intermedia]|uniref:Hydrogenase maturation factor HypB n=1 Tax=Ruegeria intermedia TaxID=996115 RepID=A0A1M5B226_9RHOB|nr:hydrogenase nickel incorporation protein HypB [Ruegeria intermedia]SHF36528.1 Hydrogenase nickel incorporation protein HypB [Ruegeria intermedia]